MSDLSTVTFSEYQEGGFLTLQVAMNGGDEASGDAHEAHHTFGFASRPDDPDSDGAGCQAFVRWEGDEGHVVVSYDPRVLEKLPQLKKGGSVQYGKTGTYAVIDGDTGAYTLYVPNADGSKASAIVVDPVADVLTVVHSSGSALVLTGDGAILKNATGDACVIVNSAGITINGNLTVNGTLSAGPTLTALLTLIGAATTPPVPVPPVLNLTH